jgi:hypothetical protein
MQRLIKRWWRFPEVILIFATVFFFVLIGCTIGHYWGNVFSSFYARKEQLIIYGIGLVTAAVVYFQIVSLQDQLEV